MELIPTDAYLEGYPAAVRATAAALRGLVREAVPDAIERVRAGWQLIGYDLPVRRYGLYFAYLAPEQTNVHLGFEYGAFMDDPSGLLSGAGVTSQVRWVTFDRPSAIDADSTIALVREAARVAVLTRGQRLALVADRGPSSA